MAIGPCATNSENGVSLKRAIKIYRGPFVYIFHYFTLMYKFCTLLVNFWSCTLCFIRKKNTRDIGSKQANSAPLLPEFWTFKSSEVKIGRYSKERKLDLSFCDYCCWNIKIWRNRQIEEYLSFFTSPHSLSHPIPSSVMYCEFQILLNHLVIKFSIMDPVILYFQISIKNRNICAIVSQKLQNTDTFVAKITISAHPNFVHFLGLFVQGVF